MHIIYPLLSVTLTHTPVQIKIYPDLTLRDKDAYSIFKFDDSQWEFGIIPKPNSKECYIRLSYWFNREGLLLFETDQQGARGQDNKFVLYVGPEHPLKLIDHRVSSEDQIKKFCSEKEIFGTGIQNAIKYLNERISDPQELESFLKMKISTGSINIAAPLDEFKKEYSKIWNNEGFYTQELMDELMWKGDHFTLEKYPQSYMDTLVRQVTETFENDFSQFFERKQTQEGAVGKTSRTINKRRHHSYPNLRTQTRHHQS